MTRKTVKLELVKASDVVGLYTITFENDDVSEFSKFMMKFRDNAKLRRDYQVILYALQKILTNGALERYFRPEGKLSDGVCALPVMSGKLRLYCLRMSEQILILGNGGVKSSRTYNEDSELNGYVLDLQSFDKLLKKAVKEGVIQVEETSLEGFENIIFDL
jgi:hypothetical protein